MQTTMERQLNVADMVLLLLFLVGIYLGFDIRITLTIPLPSALAGLAGILLLWRRRDDIMPLHLAGLLGVILLYVAASLSATDVGFLGKRFTGLVQLIYSLVIGYAFFLTILRGSRRQIAKLLLGFSLFILIGSLLETYAGLRSISDATRLILYDYGIYESDLRDQLLYGHIRPKLFTSEPSAVTFGYTLFTFGWFLVSSYRRKLILFLFLIGAGLMLMPGPTLLLSLPLLIPYYLFVDGRAPNRAAVLVLSGFLLVSAVVLGMTVYAERFSHIMAGEDPSFFYRIIGPALVALHVVQTYPWAGAGLTGETFIADLVMNVFVSSSQYSANWKIDKISSALTNYFWLHWIYLGAIWGMAVFAGLSVWLRLLGVPSILFCWAAWIVFGQASGAYVGPKTWTVLLLMAGLSILLRREAGTMTVAAMRPPVTRSVAWRSASRRPLVTGHS